MILADKDIQNRIYSNKKFGLLEGYIEEKLAKVTLAEFLYNNLGITVFLMMGIRLFPMQEIILRSWFDHNFNLNVWGRGVSKSFLACVFNCIYPIFYPDTKIIIASSVFRSTRRIITNMEKMINHKDAGLLRQCFDMKDNNKLPLNKRGDEWCLDLNGGFIKALPLNEKLRGERADILEVDEFLLVPEEIYQNVLFPFLTAKKNIGESLATKEEEDSLIQQGYLTEEERSVILSDKKIIGLSSASYDFEFLKRLYDNWVDRINVNINIPNAKTSYFVSRISYKAAPQELVDKEIADLASDGGEESDSFKREFMALFASGSDGFFNIKKLHKCTIKSGDYPCVQLKGEAKEEYILAIDPSFSSSKSSDFFAMGVYLLNRENRSIVQIHSYGIPGGDLKEHISYLKYILTSFNIVMVVADLGGANFNFIESANESGIFQDSNINLKFIDADLDSEDYLFEIGRAKNSYRISDRKICYRQIFSNEWIRKANEYLQAQIDAEKVWFGSAISASNKYMDENMALDLPILNALKDKAGRPIDKLDFVTNQDYFIEETKKQLALIEPSTTSMGKMTFDLPRNMRNSKNPERARKDNYTCLLMANWVAKCYFDMTEYKPEETQNTFTPRILK